MSKCTCGLGRVPCNSAFVYRDGKAIAEIRMDLVDNLKPGLSFLCASAGLQKLNKEVKNHERK